MNRYWRARAEAFPAPGRPPGPRSRIARSQMRGDWAPQRERLCGLTRPLPSVLVLASISIQPVKQIAEPVRNALVHHIVVHGAQLLSETSLYVTAQLALLGVGVLVAGGCAFHRFLLPQ